MIKNDGFITMADALKREQEIADKIFPPTFRTLWVRHCRDNGFDDRKKIGRFIIHEFK
jgi:hypothetical protein